MANSNAAYDLSLFESSSVAAPVAIPKKTAPKQKRVQKKTRKVVVMPKKEIEKIQRRKHNPLKLITGFGLGAAVVAVIAVVICGQIQLTQLNQQISTAQETLANCQSEYTQMQMNVDAKYSTTIVDNYAQNKLNMSKSNSSNKEYVNLSTGDKAEVIDSSSGNVFTNIINAISQLWS